MVEQLISSDELPDNYPVPTRVVSVPGLVLYPSQILTTRIWSLIREKYIRVGYKITLYPTVSVPFLF
jgi:hypothetical protein